MSQYAYNNDIPEHLLDCCMRVDTSGHYCGTRSKCRALFSMLCAENGKCKFYASNKTHYVRKSDGYVLERNGDKK